MNATKPLGRQQFAHLIPHTGNMSLIDAVECWNDKQIVCRSRSHQDPANPLRLQDALSAIHLIEYGAQAMAIHGGLLTGKASPGFLAAARNAHFYCDDLNEINEDILIAANATLKICNGAVYEFNISTANHRVLLEARATVISL
jgi:predicted hotdog family 3-hydroxylacyl-ACP dehydratase